MLAEGENDVTVTSAPHAGNAPANPVTHMTRPVFSPAPVGTTLPGPSRRTVSRALLLVTAWIAASNLGTCYECPEPRAWWVVRYPLLLKPDNFWRGTCWAEKHGEDPLTDGTRKFSELRFYGDWCYPEDSNVVSSVYRVEGDAMETYLVDEDEPCE